MEDLLVIILVISVLGAALGFLPVGNLFTLNSKLFETMFGLGLLGMTGELKVVEVVVTVELEELDLAKLSLVLVLELTFVLLLVLVLALELTLTLTVFVKGVAASTPRFPRMLLSRFTLTLPLSEEVLALTLLEEDEIMLEEVFPFKLALFNTLVVNGLGPEEELLELTPLFPTEITIICEAEFPLWSWAESKTGKLPVETAVLPIMALLRESKINPSGSPLTSYLT